MAALPPPPSPPTETSFVNNPLGAASPPILRAGQPAVFTWNTQWPSFAVVQLVDIWLCTDTSPAPACTSVQTRLPNAAGTTTWQVPAALPNGNWAVVIAANGATPSDFGVLAVPRFPVTVVDGGPPLPSASGTTVLPPFSSWTVGVPTATAAAAASGAATPTTTSTTKLASPVPSTGTTTSNDSDNAATFPWWGSLLVAAAFAGVAVLGVVGYKRRQRSQSTSRSLPVGTTSPVPVAVAGAVLLSTDDSLHLAETGSLDSRDGVDLVLVA
ncbi:hypothetical protein BC828DRAFT_390445 [Blastocladiella britannica]|nr:hypothetical protein BC828DRAFT_390445 [Blastocladiella britannica]